MSVSEASQLATFSAEFVRLIDAHNRAAEDKGRRYDSILVQLEDRVGGRRLHDLLGVLPAAIYATDAAGRIIFYNQAAAELWGLRPELGKSEWCGSWRLYWPDGSPMPHDQC